MALKTKGYSIFSIKELTMLIVTWCPGSIKKLLIGHFIETLGFDVVQNGLLDFSININARHVHGMTPYNYRKSKAVL